MTDRKLQGINIQRPWARLLLEGSKKIETRTYPLPEKFNNVDLWLIETPGQDGKFKARIIGIIRFSGSIRYKSKTEFYADSERHCVMPDDPQFKWVKEKQKFGWIVDFVSQVQEFPAPVPRGIIYSHKFSMQSEGRP